MKKLLLLLSIAGIAAGAYAQGVVDNVVGFTRVEILPQKMEILSVHSFSNGSSDVSVQDVLEKSHLVGSLYWDNADKLDVWDATSQVYVRLGLYSRDGVNKYWAENSSRWGRLTPVTTNPYEATNTFFSRGSAVWLAKPSTSVESSHAVTAGAVFDDATVSLALPPGISLIAHPYSASLPFTAISGASPTIYWDNAAKIQVWDSVGQKYLTLGFYGRGGANLSYWAENSSRWGRLTPVTTNPYETTEVIEIGKGFWYTATSGDTVTFTKNYTLDN